MRCSHHHLHQPEKKKPPCLNRIRQCGFGFCGSLSAYLFESASHFFRSVCRRSRRISPRSRFDKFNHVKYTKTLSVRNLHTRIRLLFLCEAPPTNIRRIQTSNSADHQRLLLAPACARLHAYSSARFLSAHGLIGRARFASRRSVSSSLAVPRERVRHGVRHACETSLTTAQCRRLHALARCMRHVRPTPRAASCGRARARCVSSIRLESFLNVRDRRRSVLPSGVRLRPRAHVLHAFSARANGSLVVCGRASRHARSALSRVVEDHVHAAR